MLEKYLFTEFTREKIQQREEEKNLLTVNTSGQIQKRPSPDKIGREIINQMRREITEWN